MKKEKEKNVNEKIVNDNEKVINTDPMTEEVPEVTETVPSAYSKEDIDLLNNRIKELDNKLLLSQAELVNYRKRKDEEVSNMLKFANQDIILEIIAVLDNFERAVKQNNVSEELSKFLTGFNMIYNQLVETLKKYGVIELDVLGKEFDHNTCEALMIDQDKTKENDIVTEVLMKGYMLKDRVIRPAKVKVNKL